jgi:Family of unknown function (DUF6056)
MSQAERASRHERLAFWGALFGLWLLFFVQAWNTPAVLDDWYQYPYWRKHEFSAEAILSFGYYNYFHFNPRVGDVFLLMVNGPPAVHLILTPLVEVGVLIVMFAIAFGRWPRASFRDLQLLLVVQVLLWVISPIPGIIYFYRPFTTNYLWAFGITMMLFIPYRFALLRGAGPKRWWLVPLMLVLGWVAGMCNEHTGPAAMVAIAIFIVVAWKRKQLRAWMIAGGVGLFIGYPMLFFAPGQALRYAGMATHYTPGNLLKLRGLDGCFEIILEFVAESQNGIILMLLAVLVYLRAYRKRGADVPVMPRLQVLTAALFVIAAGSIVVTLFASPTSTERLFLAPAILLVCAFAVLIERMFEEPAVKKFLVITCTIIFAYHAVRFVWVYAIAKSENDDRIAKLRDAPDDAEVEIEPYSQQRRTRWFWGDDFRYASLREYVSNEVFDLKSIGYDRHLRWAEPIAPEHYVAVRTYDPPLAPEVAKTIAPVRYIPTYWEWTMSQWRKLLATTNVDDVPGHKLVRYDVLAENTQLDDPKKRPIYVITWTPADGFTFIDGRPDDDELAQPYVRVWQESVPNNWTESYVVDCGKTHKVEPIPDDREHIGPMLPVSLDCRGVHIAIMCEPDRCWIAGKYWR